jgi:lipopolysaccharide transport system ATP-binding protein
MTGGVHVSYLGKAYKKYPSRWSRLVEWLTGKNRHELNWVLRDITFSVPRGQAVGIIGINGAGKSTLLKMITGTTQPTTGAVYSQGRIAAMLELGMGFHPDFTGRQNARMAGQLMGLSAQEIEQLIPNIEDFADVGEYFDLPLRIYSSGMQARVAFAVATVATPDVLIVDEALSVGDIAFQAKCMQRMTSLLEQGTTILFVSHSLNQVRQFCSKALYLANGRVRAWGAADTVCDVYQNDLTGFKPISASKTCEGLRFPANDFSLSRDPHLRKNSVGGMAGGSLNLEFMSLTVTNSSGMPTSSLTPCENVCFNVVIVANRVVPAGAAVGLLIADKSGYPLLSCNSNYYDAVLPELQVGEAIQLTWKFEWPFYSGEHRIDIGIKPDPHGQDFYDRVFCAKTLTTRTPTALLKKNFGGYLHVNASVTIEYRQAQKKVTNP